MHLERSGEGQGSTLGANQPSVNRQETEMEEMSIAGTVLGIAVMAFVLAVVIAQIRTESRTRQRQTREGRPEDQRTEISHERAKDREWWI